MKTRIVIVAATLAMAAAGCSKGDAATPAKDGAGGKAASTQAVPVQVIAAGEGAAGGEFTVTGTLDAVHQTPLTVKMGGIVKKLHVEVGDRVVAGQPLATMDMADRLLSVQQAEAGHAVAEVAFATAEKDYKRFSTLEAGGTISRADQEKAELGYKAAKQQLRQAEAGLGLARNMLADAVLKAPFAGQITMRVAQLGGYVDPMMHPVMFLLVDASRLKASLVLPEMRAGLLKPGDEVTLRVPASQKTFTTKVEVLSDAVDPMTRTRTAIAWVDNPGPDAVPSGSWFEARIVPAALKGRILLPAAAVRAEANGAASVYVVREGVARRAEVKGRFLADHSDFLVDEGVKAGDAVVAEASMVRDGQAVEVTR